MDFNRCASRYFCRIFNRMGFRIMKWWYLLAVIISDLIMPSSDQLIKNWGHAAEFFRILMPFIIWIVFTVIIFFYRRFITPLTEKLQDQPANTPSVQSDAKYNPEGQSVSWRFLLTAIITIVVILITEQVSKNQSFAAHDFLRELGGILFMAFAAIIFFYRRFISPIAEKLQDQPTNTPALQSEANNNHESQNIPPSNANNDRDLYLKKTAKAGNTIDYQILGNNKAKLWSARCNVTEDNVRSIQLFADALCADCLLQVTEEIPQQKYTVNNSHTNIGSITVEDQHWEYYNTNHNLVHAATLEIQTEARDELWAWLFVIFISHIDSPSLKSKYLLFNDGDGTTLGKYSFDLNNIDLTQDTTKRFDLRIAGVFAILAENSTMKNSA
jgi:hypothetical protein